MGPFGIGEAKLGLVLEHGLEKDEAHLENGDYDYLHDHLVEQIDARNTLFCLDAAVNVSQLFFIIFVNSVIHFFDWFLIALYVHWHTMTICFSSHFYAKPVIIRCNGLDALRFDGAIGVVHHLEFLFIFQIHGVFYASLKCKIRLLFSFLS